MPQFGNQEKEKRVRVCAEQFMLVVKGKERTAGRSLDALRQRDACR